MKTKNTTKAPGRQGKQKRRIFVAGEPPLVEEYSSLCKLQGYSIAVRPAKGISIALELTNLSHEQKKKNLHRLESSQRKNATIISSSTTITVEEQASWLENSSRLVGIGALPTLLDGSLIEFATSPQTSEEAKHAAEELARSLGKRFAFVRDSVGLVMPRILCALVNEACFAMMESVAAGDDIDTAMKLGTNYPKGPVEWAERIGWKQVFAVMDALHRHFGEDRYRPAPLLRAAAMGSGLKVVGGIG